MTQYAIDSSISLQQINQPVPVQVLSCNEGYDLESIERGGWNRQDTGSVITGHM